MLIHERRAMDTIRCLTDWLEIPREYLAGSRIKVSGAIKDGERLYYEAHHDGIGWKIVRETEFLCCADGYAFPKVEFLHLGEPAVRWMARMATKKLMEVPD